MGASESARERAREKEGEGGEIALSITMKAVHVAMRLPTPTLTEKGELGVLTAILVPKILGLITIDPYHETLGTACPY